MTLWPFIERELRGMARQPATYWLRVLLALMAILKCTELLHRYDASSAAQTTAGKFAAAGLPPPPTAPALTGTELLQEFGWIAFGAALGMGLLTADSISRERREGTLGLLLITRLSPLQIVQGKLLSRGLAGFTGLIAFAPAVMTTVLVGGVSGAQAVITAAGLVATLFVSLAVGVLMSVLFQRRHYALLATLGVVGALAFGPEIFGGEFLGAGAVPLVRLMGLSGWKTAASLPAPLNLVVLPWLGWVTALGWLSLQAAAGALSKNWREESMLAGGEDETADAWGWPLPSTSGSAAPRDPRTAWLGARPWDADPMRWRILRSGSVRPAVWTAVAISFAAQLALLATSFDEGPARAISWIVLLLMLAGGWLLARAGARFFQQGRRLGDLELLATTPVGGRDILICQWRELRRALMVPMGIVLVLGSPPGIAAGFMWTGYHDREFWSLLATFLMALNLLAEIFALCWVGMRFGLSARNTRSAVYSTLAVVQVFPFLGMIALFGVWSRIAPHHGMPPEIPALLFLLAKNLVLIIWSRLRLSWDLHHTRGWLRPLLLLPT